MKRLLTCVAIVFAVCVVFGLVARERSILRAAEERARQAEATARHALERARQASTASNASANPFLAAASGQPTEPGLAVWQPAAPPAPVFASQAFGQADPAANVESLRQKYVEQQAVKALLMQTAELESALETTNREIRELDAQSRLQGVSEALEKIVAECEGTQAAPVASRMLELYRNPEPAAEAAPEAAAAEEPSEATEPFADPEFNPEPGI